MVEDVEGKIMEEEGKLDPPKITFSEWGMWLAAPAIKARLGEVIGQEWTRHIIIFIVWQNWGYDIFTYVYLPWFTMVYHGLPAYKIRDIFSFGVCLVSALVSPGFLGIVSRYWTDLVFDEDISNMEEERAKQVMRSWRSFKNN